MATASPAVLPEQPTVRVRNLSVGGVLDEGIMLLHERFGRMVLIGLLVVAVPMMATMYFGVGPLEELIAAVTDPNRLRRGNEDLWRILRYIGMVTVPLLVLAYRIAEPIGLGALVYLAAGVLLGRNPTVGESVAASLKRALPLCGMWCLRWMCVQFGTLFCYVPGIMLAGLFLVALPAMMVEQIGPLKAMGRSLELTKQRLGPAMILVLLLGFIEWWVLQPLQLLPGGIARAVGVGLGYAGVLGLYAAACTVFYFTGRCQSEHYDLQLRIDEIARESQRSQAPPEPSFP